MTTASAHTVRLHRVLRAPPARVYRALLDPRAMVKWNPPHGFVGEVHEIDPRVGGAFRMSFTNLGTGQTHSFGGRYLDLVENELVRCTDAFDDPNLPGRMITAYALRAVPVGTDLTIVQEGVPSAIPIEFCYLGWQQSLDMLAALVEPEIP